MSDRILIVEDEAKIAALLRDYLQADGYEADILERGDIAVDYVRQHDPAVVLLDLMLPGMTGLDVCRAVREFSNVPIIMITARVEEIDRLLGLELGADDYICKPFSPREVIARIRVIQRRISQMSTTSDPGRDGGYLGLQVDDDRFEATLEGERLELTPIELKLLRQLLKKPGTVYSRPALMNAIYDDNRIVSDRTIDTHVKNLRSKLKAADDRQEWITSVYGVGYKLE